MRLLDYFASTQSIVALLNAADGTFIDVNPAFERMTGFTRDDAIGKMPMAIGLWDGMEFRSQLWEDLRGDGRIVGFPTTLSCADGRKLCGKLHVEFVDEGDDRHLFCFVQILPDDFQEKVSERRESLYRDHFMSASMGIYRSLIDGGFVDINPAMARITGYDSPAELLVAQGNRARDIYVDQAQDNSDYERLMAEGRLDQMRVQIRRRDGGVIWVSENARVIYDPAGRPAFIEGMLEDITHQVEGESAVRDAERRYRELFEVSPVGLFRSGLDGEILDVNAALVAVLGFASSEQLKNHYSNMRDIHADAALRQSLLERTYQDGAISQQEMQVRDSHGNLRWVSADVQLTRDSEGKPQYFTGSVQDINDRRAMERALIGSETRYRTLVEQSHVGVFIMSQTQLIYVNRALATMLGSTESALMAMNFTELFAPDARIQAIKLRARYLRTGRMPDDYETCLLHSNGQRVYVRVSVSAFDADGARHANGTVIDITRQREAELRLRFHATHDSLTGLPNRSFFNHKLAERLHSGSQHVHTRFAVLFLDLDGFKWVNDSLGHGAGDRLLLEIARRLEDDLIAESLIARYGGDEFTLLPDGACDQIRAVDIARRVLALFEKPFDIGGQQVFSGVSIGIVIGRPDYESPDQVLRDADNAMYRAKAAGKSGYVVFDEGMHAEARQRLRMETDFRLAFEHGEFVLDFQPIIELDTGKLVATEALVRWRHPTRGLIAPGQFLPIAEETGLITEMDRWVLREACRQLAYWRRTRPDWQRLIINVNVDERQMASPDILTDVAFLLDKYSIPPACLRLEITETVFRSGSGFAQNQIVALKRMGVGLAVDDFGTGYSSLEAFAASPFDALKIDQSFVRDITINARHRAIVRTIIGFAKDLGLLLTAEGIETEEQRAMLLAMGCQYGQGFLFARPLSPDQFEAQI